MGDRYGDQAVFVRRSVFESLGGFKDVPLLEDVELVVSIRNRGGTSNLVAVPLLKLSPRPCPFGISVGHLCVLDAPVVTSGRRWRLFGAVKNTLMNQVTSLCPVTSSA